MGKKGKLNHYENRTLLFQYLFWTLLLSTNDHQRFKNHSNRWVAQLPLTMTEYSPSYGNDILVRFICLLCVHLEIICSQTWEVESNCTWFAVGVGIKCEVESFCLEENLGLNSARTRIVPRAHFLLNSHTLTLFPDCSLRGGSQRRLRVRITWRA